MLLSNMRCCVVLPLVKYVEMLFESLPENDCIMHIITAAYIGRKYNEVFDI